MSKGGLFYVVAVRGRGGLMHIYRDAAPATVTPSATTLCKKYINVRPADSDELVTAKVCEDCSYALARYERKTGS